MPLIGLTGGIGSGKSSVSSRLAQRGAIIVDADAIVHELQEPGQAVFDQMVERWGEGIVAADGRLDRQAVANIVFADADELKVIEAIVHPAVRSEIERRIAEADPTDIVILDNPLLAETIRKARERPSKQTEGSTPLPEAVVVIECPPEVAIERLMEHRGFSQDDAEARIKAQASPEERREIADHLINNGGTIDELDAQIEELWAWIQRRGWVTAEAD